MLRSLCRLLIATLLSLAVVAPAAAELACSADSFAHVEQPQTASDDAGSSEEEERAGVDHCAFAHGHCHGVVALAATGPAPAFPAASYHPFPRGEHTRSPTTDLERPPRH